MFEHGLHAFFWAIRVLCSTAGSSEPRLTPRGGRVSAAAADDPDVDVDLPDGPVDRGSQVDGDDGEELIDDLGHWSAVVEVRIETTASVRNDMEIAVTRPSPDLELASPAALRRTGPPVGMTSTLRHPQQWRSSDRAELLRRSTSVQRCRRTTCRSGFGQCHRWHRLARCLPSASLPELSAVALEIGIARTHSRRQRSVSIQ